MAISLSGLPGFEKIFIKQKRFGPLFFGDAAGDCPIFLNPAPCGVSACSGISLGVLATCHVALSEEQRKSSAQDHKADSWEFRNVCVP